jgi:NADH-quinone oxidoreductase subunit C/D
VLQYLKLGSERPYRMLYDLTAIDERERTHREGQPPADFTVVYQLLSFVRNEDVRLKVALTDGQAAPTITDLWPSANWYEREVFDMFGVRFRGHPHLARILMPPWWEGHPLRREHPARATELPPFVMDAAISRREEEDLRFSPEAWGLARRSEASEFLFLNLGPQHPGMHGVLRIVLQLDGEEILDAVPDIGFHHRAAEKMGERQTWHSYIPYTDRIDYMSGVNNNLPYVLAVEQLAGIEVPERAAVIWVIAGPTGPRSVGLSQAPSRRWAATSAARPRAIASSRAEREVSARVSRCCTRSPAATVPSPRRPVLSPLVGTRRDQGPVVPSYRK